MAMQATDMYPNPLNPHQTMGERGRDQQGYFKTYPGGSLGWSNVQHCRTSSLLVQLGNTWLMM